MKLSHRDPALRLCVYNNACGAHWASVVTQYAEEEMKGPTTSQYHLLLLFLSSPFSGAQEHWSTYEREAYFMVQTLKRMNYLLACSNDVVVFTDHRNLLFTFHSTAVESLLGLHKVMKVIRLALIYQCFHTPSNSFLVEWTQWPI